MSKLDIILIRTALLWLIQLCTVMMIRRLLLGIQNSLHSIQQTEQLLDINMIQSKLIQFYGKSALITLLHSAAICLQRIEGA